MPDTNPERDPTKSHTPNNTTRSSLPIDNSHTGDEANTVEKQPIEHHGTVVTPEGAFPPGMFIASHSSRPSRIEIPGYDLLPEIARGGMGVVHLARDRAFNREVAIKVMLPGKLAEEFSREASITARLPHPGIPPVHTMGVLPDGRPYLVMKLIHGETLDAVLKKHGNPGNDRGRLLAIFEQMCHAVGYAHAQGIIHRDIKPSNVMVGEFGEVQVMDWGLAKEIDSADAGTTHDVQANRNARDIAATVAGTVKGTPAYMAPEQARGEPVDRRADVFALGGILAVILTKKPPFVGDSVIDTVLRAAQAELADVFARLDACGADAELIALCKSCLAADRDKRPSDATELAGLVAAYRAEVESRLQRAELESVRTEEGRRRRRTQWILAGTVTLLLAAAGTGATITQLWRTAETQRDAANTAKGLAVEEKANADKAKVIAENAKEEAFKQKREADKAKENETAARQHLAVVEYGRTLQVAHQEWRDGNLVAMRMLLDGTDPKVRGWEWRYLNRLHDPALLTLKGHTHEVFFASFSPDDTQIVTASKDATAKVWDANTGIERCTLKGHKSEIWWARFSPDGTRIVTASSDKTAKVWDAKTGAEIITLKGHTFSLRSASFNHDGTRVVTASGDGTARVWDVKTGVELQLLKSPSGYINSAEFSPDGARILTAISNDTAKVWDAKTGTELLTLKGHRRHLNSAAFNVDGTRIVTASSDETAKVWDAKTGAELFTLKGHTSDVFSACFSQDDKRIVTASRDNTAKTWDAKTGTEILTFKGHTGWVRSAILSADGRKIVTASEDKTAKVWDSTIPAELVTLAEQVYTPFSNKFSPDRTKVLVVPIKNFVQVCDAKTGAQLLTLKGHTGEVWFAAFSPDGTRIATASHDMTARVWDAKTGAELLTLKGHKTFVINAYFSPDGTRVFSVSVDNQMKVWDARPITDLQPAVAPLPREK